MSYGDFTLYGSINLCFLQCIWLELQNLLPVVQYSINLTSFFLCEKHEYNTDDDESFGPPLHPVVISFCGKHCKYVHCVCYFHVCANVHISTFVSCVSVYVYTVGPCLSTTFIPHKMCQINQVLDNPGKFVHRVMVMIHSGVLDK